MERYEVSWPPSPSYHVDRHEVHVGIDGGSPGKVADVLASATTAEISVATGASVEVFVRTFADNGTQADSNHLTFNATDETPVQPVGDLSVRWLGHTP